MDDAGHATSRIEEGPDGFIGRRELTGGAQQTQIGPRLMSASPCCVVKGLGGGAQTRIPAASVEDDGQDLDLLSGGFGIAVAMEDS